MGTLLRPAALVLIFWLSACAGSAGGGNGPAPDSSARARIENRSSFDMDIYVRRSSGQLSRLGFVPAAETVGFQLARALTAGAASFRLEARPAGGGGRPVVSDPLPRTPRRRGVLVDPSDVGAGGAPPGR